MLLVGNRLKSKQKATKKLTTRNAASYMNIFKIFWTYFEIHAGTNDLFTALNSRCLLLVDKYESTELSISLRKRTNSTLLPTFIYNTTHKQFIAWLGYLNSLIQWKVCYIFPPIWAYVQIELPSRRDLLHCNSPCKLSATSPAALFLRRKYPKKCLVH